MANLAMGSQAIASPMISADFRTMDNARPLPPCFPLIAGQAMSICKPDAGYELEHGSKALAASMRRASSTAGSCITANKKALGVNAWPLGSGA